MKPMDKGLRLEGERIYLRPITVEDTELVLSWRNARTVVENFIYRKPITVPEHLNWLENKVFTGQVHQFVICGKTDDKPLGCVYLQRIDEENHRAESGIFLSADARGKGVGIEAERLLTQYAFDALSLHKLTARVLSYNTPSLRLHERAGYRREAYLREQLFLDGEYVDVVYYGLIKGEMRQ